MNAFVKSILEPKTASVAMLKNRSQYITHLHGLMDIKEISLAFLTQKLIVMRHVRNSTNLGTQRTRLMHIIKTIDADPTKTVPKAVKDYYGRLAAKLKDPVKKIENTNIMNETQKERFLSLSGLKSRLESKIYALFNDYELPVAQNISDMTIDKFSIANNRDKNIYTFAKRLQEICFVGCYILQPALRNNYVGLTLTRRAIGLKKDQNYMIVNVNPKDRSMFKIRLVLNHFKNVKHMGQQTIHLDPNLSTLLSIWINLLEKLYPEKVSSPFLWSINAKGKMVLSDSEASAARQLPRIGEKLFGKPLSVNDYRHIHEIYIQNADGYNRMSVQEQTDLHAQLLHSHGTAKKYILHRRD